MDRLLKPRDFHASLSERVAYGDQDSVPVEQSSCKDFNFDKSTGFPMSDMTAILRADAMAARVKLSELQEFKAEFLPAETTDEDALKYYQPRLAQMPSELAELSEDIARQRWEDYKKDKETKDSEEEAALYKEWLENYLKSQKSSTKVEPIKSE